MHLLLPIIVLTLLCHCTFGQSWTEVSPFLGTERDDGVAFSINGKGYAGTGFAEGFVLTNDFYAYDPDVDSWSGVASLPSEPRQYCGRFTIADTGYVVCGFGQSGYLNELWAYHPKSDTWSQKAPFPGQPRSSPIAFSIAGKAYVGTGRNGDIYFDDFWEYDPEQDAWFQLNDFPGEPRFEAIGMNLGSFGFAGLGRLQDNSFTTDWWQFNPATDQWLRKNDFAGENRYYAVEFSLNGYGYVAAGQDEDLQYLNQVFEYDSFNDEWVETAPIPSVPLKGAFTFSLGNSAFLGVGITSQDLRLDNMYRFEKPIEDKMIRVYPNPASDVVFFAWKGESPESMELYNSHGKLINSTVIIDEFYLEERLSYLSIGAYIARFRWKDGSEVSKAFIKGSN